MTQYKCAAADCPFPDTIYAQRLRQPPACSLGYGHCRVEPVGVSRGDAAQPAPPHDPLDLRPEGEDLPAIFDFLHATERPRLAEPPVVLIAGDQRFVLPNPCTLGRLGDVAREAFGDDTISRYHARLTVGACTALLENISERNTLTVNNVPVAAGAGYALKRGPNRVRFGPAFTCELELLR
jgi:hypothetical protein